MKENKYRVWDKKNKCWIKKCYMDQSGDIYIYNRIRDSYDKALFVQENVEICFYIALKDRKGREIYEGDIYRYPNSEAGYCVPNTPDDLIGIIRDIAEFYDDEYLKCRLENAEIIGNVWENSELKEI